MKKLLSGICIALIAPCFSFGGEYKFLGVAVEVQNKTFDYSIKGAMASNYVANTYYHYSRGDYKKYYFNILIGEQDYPFTLPDDKKCYTSRDTLKSCVPKGWMDGTGYSIKGPIASIFNPYIEVRELRSGFNYGISYSYFDDNQVETLISPDFGDPGYRNLMISIPPPSDMDGWRRFPGAVNPSASMSLSFSNLGKEAQNIKFDVYDENDTKVTSVVIIVSYDKEATYFFTKPVPGLKMDLESTTVGKYGQFTYNLNES